MKILFSPVGANDPYYEERDPATNAVTGVHEGPLLQICRQEKPDKVYLYFSGDAPRLEQEDRRFHNALEQLVPQPEVQVILRLDVTDDADTAFLKEDFRTILTDIRNEAPDDSALIVNVFSGTDAMREAFKQLADEMGGSDEDEDDVTAEAEDIAVSDDEDEDPSAFFEGFDGDDKEPVHVPDEEAEEIEEELEMLEAAENAASEPPIAPEDEITAAEPAEVPAEEESAESAGEADVDTAEESAEEPAADSDAASEEEPAADAAAEPAAPEVPAVDTAALIADEQKKLLCALIDAQEYRAAQVLTQNAEQPLSPQFTALLDAAVLRSSGKWTAALQKFCELGQNDLTAGVAPVTDYFLRLEQLADRDDCTGFFRAVPALLVEVFLAVIRKQFNSDLTQYMIYGSRKWDENKLVMAQMTGKFSETYIYHTKPHPMKVGGFVTTAHLSNYMENVSDRKKHAQMILETMKLRQYAEEKVKNVTTYSLSATSGAEMQKFNLLPPSQLIRMIRDYIRSYTDISLSDEVLGSYEKMNAALKAAL